MSRPIGMCLIYLPWWMCYSDDNQQHESCGNIIQTSHTNIDIDQGVTDMSYKHVSLERPPKTM